MSDDHLQEIIQSMKLFAPERQYSMELVSHYDVQEG
jgi:hypothetical protein